MSDAHQAVTVTSEDTPNPAEVAYLEGQLNAYNVRMTGYEDYRPLGVFARDASGAIVGGLSGFTWGGALKILLLWVDERHRGQGVGTQCIHEAEREAKARGCVQGLLDTHSFQAPAFYRRLGYVQCGVAEDWPVGHQQYWFTKHLV
jgi:GNAT superfamily N-acetyltransferase